MEKTTKLSNGIECPTMGLGAMLAKGEDLTYQAIKDGTRLIDTAAAYRIAWLRRQRRVLYTSHHPKRQIQLAVEHPFVL